MSIGLLMMGGMGTAVAAAFTPAALFAGSEQGFWAPVTTSRLWQDTARTTPVTTAGDPVGSWQLSTSGAVVYAEQATSAKRPTYQVASGKGYLDFDGVDDCLQLATLNLTANDKMTAVAGLRADTAASGMVAEHSTNAGGATPGSSYFYWTGSGYEVISRGSAGLVGGQSALSATISPPATSVITALHDIVGDSTSLRVNGTASGSVGTADKGTGNFGSYELFIGQCGASSLSFDGRIYGMIIHGTLLSGTNLTNAETWMQGLVV